MTAKEFLKEKYAGYPEIFEAEFKEFAEIKCREQHSNTIHIVIDILETYLISLKEGTMDEGAVEVLDDALRQISKLETELPIL